MSLIVGIGLVAGYAYGRLGGTDPSADTAASADQTSSGSTKTPAIRSSAPAELANVAPAVDPNVARVVGVGVYAFDGPESGHPVGWFPNPTQFDGPRVFLVLDAHSDPDRVEVLLPTRPNGETGWIDRTSVLLTQVDHRIEVDLSDRSVIAWHGDEKIVETTAVIGADATPTPTGLFFIRDVIEQHDPNGVYGSHIVALSGFSEVLETFDGGLPAIAIHGTNNPAVIGEKRSNGCVRVENDQAALLAQVPLGTPVEIVP